MVKNVRSNFLELKFWGRKVVGIIIIMFLSNAIWWAKKKKIQLQAQNKTILEATLPTSYIFFSGRFPFISRGPEFLMNSAVKRPTPWTVLFKCHSCISRGWIIHPGSAGGGHAVVGSYDGVSRVRFMSPQCPTALSIIFSFFFPHVS